MLARRDVILRLIGVSLPLAVPGLLRAQGATPVASALSPVEAINTAGQQRMLSQRCAKAWLMLALGVLPDRAARWLDASIARFDAQLLELATLQPSAELQTLLVQQAADWRGYREALGQPPGKAAAAEVFARNEAVLRVTHATTQAYERLAGSPVGRLINVSGRQRMLSQRMAKFAYFSRYGVESQRAGEGLRVARGEFVRALKILNTAPENSPRIHDALALAGQQWFFFEDALAQGNHPHALQTIATTSERMLEQLDLVVRLYEGLSPAS